MRTPVLEAVSKAIRAEAWREALALALPLWRSSRDGALGRLIVAVGQRVDASIKPLAGPKADIVKKQLSWAKKQDPVTLGRLLEPNPVGNWADRYRLMEALAEWPADPRIGHHGLVLARSFQRDHVTVPSYFPPLGDVLLRHADGAVAEAAKDKRSNLTRDEAKALAASLKGSTPLAAADRQQVEGLLKSLEGSFAAGAGDEAALLEAVYRHPEDDGARAVYADTLTARGDVRGEFITLQLLPRPTAEQRKRTKELLGKHEKTWSGPLTVVLEGRKYERGFLVSGRLALGWSEDEEFHADAPEWRTVERLEDARVEIGPQFRQLVEMETSDPLVGHFPRLERLDVSGFEQLAKAELPKLRSLAVSYPKPGLLKAYFKRGAAPALESLLVRHQDAGTLMALPLPPTLTRVACSDQVALTRGAGGWLLELRAASSGDYPKLGRALAGLEKQPLTGITFTGTWSRFGPRNLADEVGPKLRALITTFIEQSRGKFEK